MFSDLLSVKITAGEDYDFVENEEYLEVCTAKSINLSCYTFKY